MTDVVDERERVDKARILKHCVCWRHWTLGSLACDGSSIADLEMMAAGLGLWRLFLLYFSFMVISKVYWNCQSVSLRSTVLLVGPFPSRSVSAPCPHSCFIEDVIWLKIGFLPPFLPSLRRRRGGGGAGFTAQSTVHSPFYSIRIIILPPSLPPCYAPTSLLPFPSWMHAWYCLCIMLLTLLAIELEFATPIVDRMT